MRAAFRDDAHGGGLGIIAGGPVSALDTPRRGVGGTACRLRLWRWRRHNAASGTRGENGFGRRAAGGDEHATRFDEEARSEEQHLAQLPAMLEALAEGDTGDGTSHERRAELAQATNQTGTSRRASGSAGRRLHGGPGRAPEDLARMP